MEIFNEVQRERKKRNDRSQRKKQYRKRGRGSRQERAASITPPTRSQCLPPEYRGGGDNCQGIYGKIGVRNFKVTTVRRKGPSRGTGSSKNEPDQVSIKAHEKGTKGGGRSWKV